MTIVLGRWIVRSSTMPSCGFTVVSTGRGLLVKVYVIILVALLGASVPALDVSAQVQVLDYRLINSLENLADLPLDLDLEMGGALTSLGDLDGDGVDEIVAGADTGIWIIFPDSRGIAKSYVSINETIGGFTGTISSDDDFGCAVEAIGDLDGDGMIDLAVGAMFDDDGGSNKGAVWILFLNTDCTVKSHQKISDTEGGFTGILGNDCKFGSSLGALGDMDGDGVEDLAVGNYLDNDGGDYRGAIWILFLNTNGTVKAYQKVSDLAGGFTGILDDFDCFGVSVTSLGDLDNDGVDDLAVGAHGDDDQYSSAGAVWILFMNSNGTVKANQKISDLDGNFFAPLYTNHYFGADLASSGDIDGDGVEDLMVGAYGDIYGYYGVGRVYMLFLNTNGTVKDYERIDHWSSNFIGSLSNNDFFGYGVSSTGDIDGDGVLDFVVGAWGDDDCVNNSGSVWFLMMNSDGTLKTNQKVSCSVGGLIGMMENYEQFGSSAAAIGDWDGNGVPDIAVGAVKDIERYAREGAIWILLMDSNGEVESYQKISAVSGDFPADIDFNDAFGCAVDSIGDLDSNGYTDLVVGACWDDDGDTDNGAVYVLMMNADYKVDSYVKISDTSGGFTGTLSAGCQFGSSVASLGDLDEDGVSDIAVGAVQDADGGNSGAVWILFLNPNGTVKAHQKISAAAGDFTGVLGTDDYFGSSVANLGDLDSDGIVDMAVGARLDDDGYSNAGAVWILFLDSDGSVKSYQKLSATEGGFPGPEYVDEAFGCDVARAGDLDGDGLQDLLVGAYGDYDGGSVKGLVWVLLLNADGTVRSYSKISDSSGNFSGYITSDDQFGFAVAGPGDIDGNGMNDIIIGAPFDDNGSSATYQRGSIWAVMLEQEPSSCDVSLSSILFEVEGVGSYRDTTITITNAGGYTLSGTISESSDHFSIISGGGAYSIVPDHFLDVTIRYEPLSAGTHYCTIETGDALCTDVSCTGTTTLTVTVATVPPGLLVNVDMAYHTAPYQFITGSGVMHFIGTDYQQVKNDTTYIFTGWGDGGAVTRYITTGVADTVFTAFFKDFTSCAVIDSIVDVPDDQGGWARIYFKRSMYDAADEALYPISGYNIYRRISQAPLVSNVLSGGEKVDGERLSQYVSDQPGPFPVAMKSDVSEYYLYDDRLFMLSRDVLAAAPPGLWEFISSIYATQQEQYVLLAPTRADSSAVIPWEAFYISAHSTTPSVYFESPPDSGYSVDNIAPGVPLGLSIAYNTGSGNELTWVSSPEEDFQYYRIYRDADEAFVHGPGNLVHQTSDPQWTDLAHDGSGRLLQGHCTGLCRE